METPPTPAGTVTNTNTQAGSHDLADRIGTYPAVPVTATAEPVNAREWWWEIWKTLPPIERGRPAADVQVEVRDDDT